MMDCCTATTADGSRCPNLIIPCPLPCCSSPEITSDTCWWHMDTRIVAGKAMSMCARCCWKFDHPEAQDPQFALWLAEQNGGGSELSIREDLCTS